MIKNKFRYVFIECGYKFGDMGKVAEAIGISKPTMTMLMNRDNYAPTLENAIKIARFFDKSVEEIFVVEE